MNGYDMVIAMCSIMCVCVLPRTGRDGAIVWAVLVWPASGARYRSAA